MNESNYTPSKEIISKYADLLVNFALGGGTGIKKGDVVLVQGSEACRPLYIELVKAVWRAGGHTIADYSTDTYSDEDNLDRYFYENASDEQIGFFKKDYARGLIKQIDHEVIVLCDTNLQALKGVDPAKMMKRGLVSKPLHDWMDKKENEGKFTWTLGLYGTEAMAKEAGLSLEEYWQQIIEACYLDKPDPIAEWKKIYKQIKEYTTKLDAMNIEWVKVQGEDIDLKIKIGKERSWEGGGGRNIPSFEIFTSPDWRGTEGWARFNQPLYRYGNSVEGIELWFENGRVVKSKAAKNEKVLQEMIATDGADKLGEFSMTDARFSRITHFMAETLFDENIGGEFGNTHVAVGLSYKDCYKGDPSKVTKAEWKKMGYNDSSVHTDIVTTTNRTVTAILPDGSEKVIYKNGRFVI
jgi:aminopeptidase